MAVLRHHVLVANDLLKESHLSKYPRNLKPRDNFHGKFFMHALSRCLIHFKSHGNKLTFYWLLENFHQVKKWFLEFTKLVTPRGKAWKMDWLLCLCTIWFKPIIRLKFEFWNQESNWCKYLLIYVMISIIHKFLFIIGQTYLTFPQA